MRAIMAACSRGPVRLLRNNLGVGLQVPAGTIQAAIAILARHGISARPLRFGVGNPGGSDLLGVRTITIEPRHVGQRIGQAATIEVKTQRGRVSPDQERFRAAAERMGCIAAVVRSVEQAQAMLRGEG